MKELAVERKQTADEENTNRPSWAKSWDFVFAAVGCSVGVGNVWRFPYLCYKHGGGAFLIPYLLFATFFSFPLLVLDSSLGQKSRRGLAQCWNIAPIFKGIALAQFVLILHHNISYPIILVWACKYLVSSFSSVLPWANCDNDWNTVRCVTFNLHQPNSSFPANTTYANTTSASLEFWKFEVLHLSDGIENLGGVVPDLVLYLCLLWLFFYLSTFKGIKWSAKIVYATATLPIVLLVVILCRSVQLEGAGDGIKYFLIPDLHKLSDFKVWANAFSQVIFSTAPGIGVLISLSSFNEYHHNFWRDSIIVVLSNIFVSFVGGLAIFSTLGFMVHNQNSSMEQVATSGPGLAFVVYPETLSLLPLPQLWCVLFFLMILALGFDTVFVCQETLITAILDNCKRVSGHRYGREIAQAILSVFLMILSLPLATEGGVYVFELHSSYSIAGWCWLLILTCECVGVAWFYGFDRQWAAIVDMIGERRGRMVMKFSWQYVAPITCTAMALYAMANLNSPTYNEYTYPVWAEVLGHLTSLSSVVFIPGYAIYKLLKTPRRREDIRKILSQPASVERDDKVEELSDLRSNVDA